MAAVPHAHGSTSLTILSLSKDGRERSRTTWERVSQEWPASRGPVGTALAHARAGQLNFFNFSQSNTPCGTYFLRLASNDGSARDGSGAIRSFGLPVPS